MSLTRNEVYVKALLEGYEELREKRYYGLWHISDVFADLEEAMRLADLTDRQRETLRLYYFEHNEQSEIAERLGISQRVVSFHVESAIKKIANTYEHWEALEYVNKTI